MSITKINQWFAKSGEIQIKYRFFFLAAILIFTLAGFAGLSRFKVDTDQSGWLTNNEDIKRGEDRFKECFGNEDSVMVLVEAPDVFAPEVLDAIDRLGKRLEAEVPFADKVTSLMSLSVSKGTDEGMEIVNPFADGIPGGGKPLSAMSAEEKAELQQKKDFILSRTSLVNNLVSDDATETWVILSLVAYGDDTEREDMLTVGKAAIPIVESGEFKSDLYTMRGAGLGYTEAEEEVVVSKETRLRVLSGFIVMLLSLIFLIRSLRGIIVPVTATLCGIGVVLGYASWAGIVADGNMITLPIMLGMALAVGYSVHYVNAFRLEFRTCGRRRQAVVNTLQTSGWPILFTVATTVASLISFMGVGIEPLKWVGGMSACVVFAVYLYTIVLLPIFYSFGKDMPSARENAGQKALEKERRRKARQEKVDSLYGAFGEHVIKRRVAVIAIGVAVTAAAVFGMLRIRVNMDYTGIMGEKIPYVARLIKIRQSKLGSQYSYNVMVELPEADGFKNPEAMQALDDCAKEFGMFELTKISGEKPRVTSVIDLVKEMNKTLNGDEEAAYVIPEDADLLTQLLFLYELSDSQTLFSRVSDDYSTAFIRVELSKYDAELMVHDITAAKRIAQEHFPGAEVSIVGEVAKMADLNRKLVVGELKSFAASFIIIALMLTLAFGSLKTGLIAMIPNIAPVFLVGGVMGFAGYTLDMLTMTVMPMILGIAVDDTIHFTNHVKYEHEIGGSYYAAVIDSFKKIGRSMASSTFILCAMFFMYTFSDMSMLFRIGLLSMIGLAAALLADYTVTPALLFLTKPFGGRKDE
ncbi:MAG: efflux RND transporter permease subunit [Treponema sp.]